MGIGAVRTINVKYPVSDFVIAKFDSANRAYYIGATYVNKGNRAQLRVADSVLGVATTLNSTLAMKFSLTLNQTEWMQYNDESVHMVMKDVALCGNEDYVVFLGEIKSNTLREGTVGGVDNTTNVFAINYFRTGGAVGWVQLLGDAEGDDIYTGASYFSGFIYVLQNSRTTVYNTLGQRSLHIRLTKIRVESGDTSSPVFLGSNDDHPALGVSVSHQGISPMLADLISF